MNFRGFHIARKVISDKKKYEILWGIIQSKEIFKPFSITEYVGVLGFVSDYMNMLKENNRIIVYLNDIGDFLMMKENGRLVWSLVYLPCYCY